MTELKVNEKQNILQIAAATKRDQNTVKNWFDTDKYGKNGHELLTLEASLQVIQKITGKSRKELLCN